MIDLYLRDPFLRRFMRERGWSTRASAYRPGLLTRTLRKLRARATPEAPAGG
jgi:hypothetical protein